MIGKLTGIVDSIGEGHMLLDVGGVGYLAFCSSRCLGRMPPRGGSVSLLIETHVREDHIHLYGFADAAERDWFRLLTTVQGVGAKSALAILSALGPADLARAIASGDKAALTQADGVGSKLALRLVTELKDKVGGIAAEAVRLAGWAEKQHSEASAARDAISALVNLGYGRSEALSAVARAATAEGERASVEALVRRGLKELAT